MKVSFIVGMRNKAHPKFQLEKCLSSVLEQTYSPMDIYFSDQGSEDDTFAIASRLADTYNGPNRVHMLRCPHTEWRGMAGLNCHFNWLHNNIDGDVVIWSSADDMNHIERAKHTVAVFEKHNPSFVGVRLGQIGAQGWIGETPYPQESGWVQGPELITGMTGSSAAPAWARDFYEKHGPLRGTESQDMVLPVLACYERGYYYERGPFPLYIYVQHGDVANTGLEGRILAAKSADERMQLIELTNAHVQSNYFSVLRRLQAMEVECDDTKATVYSKIIEGGLLWSNSRDMLAIKKIQPLSFPT